MTDFSGLAAVVSGGASGIGRATAVRLLRDGARVAVLDRDPAHLDGALALPADVSSEHDVRAAVDRAAEEFQGIDIVVNSAGIGAQGSVASTDFAGWARLFDVNVTGTARVVQAALPHLRRSRHAAVVNVASVAALTGLPDRALYSATKGAVLALTRAMAADHLADGVRVNCVSPGTVDTPWVSRLLASAEDPEATAAALRARQPHGRLVTAEEVADAIAYLASPSAASTTGVSLSVDGGMQALRVNR